MMNEWQTRSLAQICSSIEDGDWIEKKDQSDNGIRLIQTGNVGVGVYIDKEEKAKFISEDTFRRLKCLEVFEGDILISRLPDPVGRACIVPAMSTKCVTAVDCSVLKLGKDILPQWLIYYTQSSAYFRKIKTECSGTTRERITRKKLSGIPISFPTSIKEQQRIINILDAEFEKIDALKETAEYNLQNAKALFQSVLTRELEPKEGWKIVTIGEIADLKGGKRVPKGYKLKTESTGYPYIRVADFNEKGSVDLDDIHYISKEVYEGIKRYIITIDDIYISIAGTIGKSGIIPIELNGANLTENACRLILKGNINNKYIYFCTISNQFKTQISKLTKQATQPKLALTRLATATINLPSRPEQDKIVALLSVLNDKCKALETNYEKIITLCDDLKQALLRKAFSGEL